MIDFSNAPVLKKGYAGANGSKLAVLYHDDVWMLKFPSMAKLNPELSYTNSCISEYLGSHIFNLLGIEAQETLLGTYSYHGKEKLVVACKDFTAGGETLQDFASIKNRVIDSERNGYGTDLVDVLQTINEQNIIDPDALKTHFWDMFIVDSLIGNWDRHNGNWGFLYNIKTDAIRLAPVYDCGSSLFPQADLSVMEQVLSSKAETDARVYNRPLSALQLHGKRINYFDFISALQNEDCNRSLERIAARIDMREISHLIDQTEGLNETQAAFYKHMISARKEEILDYSLARLKTVGRGEPKKSVSHDISGKSDMEHIMAKLNPVEQKQPVPHDTEQEWNY